jgi:hypothetical protein
MTSILFTNGGFHKAETRWIGHVTPNMSMLKWFLCRISDEYAKCLRLDSIKSFQEVKRNYSKRSIDRYR